MMNLTSGSSLLAARAAPVGPRHARLAVRGSRRLQCGLHRMAVRKIMTLTITLLLLLATTSQSQKSTHSMRASLLIQGRGLSRVLISDVGGVPRTAESWYHPTAITFTGDTS